MVIPSRIALLLFGSGMCALIYQVTWLRELRLVFGASTPATATVLAVFMGGLGYGRRSRRQSKYISHGRARARCEYQFSQPLSSTLVLLGTEEHTSVLCPLCATNNGNLGFGKTFLCAGRGCSRVKTGRDAGAAFAILTLNLARIICALTDRSTKTGLRKARSTTTNIPALSGDQGAVCLDHELGATQASALSYVPRDATLLEFRH